MMDRVLILDLGDVLFHWNTSSLTLLPPASLHSVILSPTWGALERGELCEEAAIKAIGDELSISRETIHGALQQCRRTLKVDTELVDQLRKLKGSKGGDLKVFAMTNISCGDFDFLRAVLSDWSVFDKVFTSFDAGKRKPELDFYAHVLEATGADPTKAIFVDDKIDNVIAARSLGIKGIVFDDAKTFIRQLQNLLNDPVERGKNYLDLHRGRHMSMIENGPSFHDAFSQFLIREMTQDESLIHVWHADDSAAQDEKGIISDSPKPRLWNYFLTPPVGTTPTFPDDVDTTSYSLLSLPPSSSTPPPPTITATLTAILSNTNPDNLIQTYFSPTRPRIDPTVLTNVARLFYKYARGHQVQPSLDHVRRTLMHRGYVDGTHHYYSAESFLFFLSRLVASHGDAEIQDLREPLAQRLRERVGRRDDSLAVAMRVLACQAVGVWAGSDVEYLKELQDVDGGWEIGWVCRFGRSRRRIGSRGVVTAYAVKALENERVAYGE